MSQISHLSSSKEMLPTRNLQPVTCYTTFHYSIAPTLQYSNPRLASVRFVVSCFLIPIPCDVNV